MIILATLIPFLVLVNSTNYCKICADHIGCKNNGQISATCIKVATMVDVDEFKNTFIKQHHKYRNKIALGEIKGFKPATRMPTIEWDTELAQLAELNVKTCQFKHDACRDTKRFMYSGQNVARWRGYPAIDVKEASENFVTNWFNEYEDTDMSIIENYEPPSKTVGHFALMVSDRNTKFGCAMIKTFDDPITTYTATCNYATNNMIGEPIYKSGPAASECKTGINPKYRGLCSPAEDIDPNAF